MDSESKSILRCRSGVIRADCQKNSLGGAPRGQSQHRLNVGRWMRVLQTRLAHAADGVRHRTKVKLLIGDFIYV